MDYMNLGVRSRKTGINAKQNIERDEYSMENIDEFFNDDTEVTINNTLPTRNEFLTNNILPKIEDNIQENKFKIPKFPFIKSSISRRESSIQDFRNSADISTSEQQELQYNDDNYMPIDDVNDDDKGSDNDDNTNNINIHNKIEDSSVYEDEITLPHPKYAPKNDEYMGDDYTREIEQEIKLTPTKLHRADYKDVPDLIEDDENEDEDDVSRGETTFNTSDNAILENEIRDDSDEHYELLSEEDRDYVQDELSSDDYDEDDDESTFSENEQIQNRDKNDGASESIQHSNKRRKNSGFLDEDSDEEYIQSQAADLLVHDDEGDRSNTGKRKSSRIKVAPLEYWRNEKIIYKRKTNKPELEIDKIVTYDYVDEDEAEAEANRAERQKKMTATRTRPYNYVPTGKRRGRPRKPKDLNAMNPNNQLLKDINSGTVPHTQWIQRGILEANVNVSASEKKDEIVAFAPNLSQSEQVRETDEEKFSLEVMFDKYKEHFASGMLKLPIASKKKLNESYNTFMTFYVIQGIVEVVLSNNKFVVVEGSSFQVPAFNQYAFENKGLNEVKMFFVQVTVDEDFNSKDKPPKLFHSENEASSDFDQQLDELNIKKENETSGTT